MEFLLVTVHSLYCLPVLSFCCWSDEDSPSSHFANSTILTWRNHPATDLYMTGNGNLWTQSSPRTQKVTADMKASELMTLLCHKFLISFTTWFPELFQDLSQLQEIWIAEGEFSTITHINTILNFCNVEGTSLFSAPLFSCFNKH